MMIGQVGLFVGLNVCLQRAKVRLTRRLYYALRFDVVKPQPGWINRKLEHIYFAL